MNAMDFFEQIVALQREGQPFAVATVVARRAPVSAHLGDRAIVFADGRMEGFVGGACSREIIRKQALEAIQARCGRLVSIRPDARETAESTAEHVFVPMTCVSEGAIDVYVEPFVQPRRLIIVGATPVAEALARLARSMDYDVVRAVEGREWHDIEQEATRLGITVVTLDALEKLLREGSSAGADQAAVVASQGHYDEQALESILKYGLSYVGLVASRKRGAAVQELLEASGCAGRRDDPKSSGDRSGRANPAGGCAVDPRRNRAVTSMRRAQGGGCSDNSCRRCRDTSANERGGSGVRDAGRDYDRTATRQKWTMWSITSAARAAARDFLKIRRNIEPATR